MAENNKKNLISFWLVNGLFYGFQVGLC